MKLSDSDLDSNKITYSIYHEDQHKYPTKLAEIKNWLNDKCRSWSYNIHDGISLNGLETIGAVYQFFIPDDKTAVAFKLRFGNSSRQWN